VIQFGSNLILTRLLFPEAFGIMALATVFLVGLAMFSDIGLKTAIIRDPRGNDPAFLNTAWTLQVIRGFALAVGACVIAYPLSLIYGQPILFPLLCLIATTTIFSGFACVTIAMAERDLALRMPTLIALTGQISGVIILVALAWWMRSVWALAIGNVISAAISLALGHLVMRGHRHCLVMDREAATSLLHFGKWIFLSTAVTFLGNEGLKAVQASFVPIETFGILAIAYSITAIPNELYSRLATSIGFPALSEINRKNPQGMRTALRKFRFPLLSFSAVIYTVLAVLARPMIELLYDPRYHEAAIYLEFLLPAGFLATIPQGYQSVLLAIGKSQDYLVVMIITALCRLLGVYFGFLWGGVSGMLIGLSGANFIIVLAIWVVARRFQILDLGLDLTVLVYSVLLFSYVVGVMSIG
jgi:O-antigen/teichoic acid export membrane protein